MEGILIQKYSSNVVECFIKNRISQMISYLFAHFANEKNLINTICHQFGNFVVKTLILQCQEDERTKALIAILKKNMELIASNDYGMKVLKNIEGIMGAEGNNFGNFRRSNPGFRGGKRGGGFNQTQSGYRRAPEEPMAYTGGYPSHDYRRGGQQEAPHFQYELNTYPHRRHPEGGDSFQVQVPGMMYYPQTHMNAGAPLPTYGMHLNLNVNVNYGSDGHYQKQPTGKNSTQSFKGQRK